MPVFQNRLFKNNAWLFRSSPDFALRTQREDDQVTTEIHSHECVEMAVVISGKGIHKSGNESVPLVPGDVFVIPPGTKHQLVAVPGIPLEINNLLYSPEAIPLPRLDVCRVPEFEQIFTPRPKSPVLHLRLDSTAFRELETLLDLFLGEENSRLVGCRMCRLGLFMAIIARLVRFHAQSPGRYEFTPGIRLVLEKLNREFLKNISVHDLSHFCCMSRSNFMRLFKESTGMSPLQYILRLRIDHACRKLAETDSTISEIGFASGFSDSNYFTRIFKKITGMTPKDYRRIILIPKKTDS